MNKKLQIVPFVLFLSFLSFSQIQTVGVFQNDSLSYNGYTLFTSNKTTYLIDNCGFIINTWSSDFRPGQAVYLLENGNLLRTGFVGGSFSGGGQGGRIELFDWDGNLLWGYNYADAQRHHHHDVEPLPNGNILVLAWELRTKEEALQAGRLSPQEIWPEQIVEIEPVGSNEINIVWEWHLWDHLIQDVDANKDNFGVIADHPELVNVNFTNPNLINFNPDWVHANAINYQAELDQIAISCRNFNEIWIIDHSTTTEEAAGHTGGNAGKGGDLLYRWGNPANYNRGTEADQTLFGQHDIRWVPAGHPFEGSLMVFNNLKIDGGLSAVDIWEPPTQDANGNYMLEEGGPYGPLMPFWTYEEENFGSSRVSGAHSLPNGNILVCEGRKGRFFEVLPDAKTIVWEYINPAANGDFNFEQGEPALGNQTFRVTRYSVDYPAFAGRDLSPGIPIEVNPLVSDCMITTSIRDWEILEGVQVLNNPIFSEMVINNEQSINLHMEVFNIAGQPIFQKEIGHGRNTFNVGDWEKGFYVVQFVNEDLQKRAVQKIVKQ